MLFPVLHRYNQSRVVLLESMLYETLVGSDEVGSGRSGDGRM